MIPIVTVMNYSDPAGIAMCKGWVYLARRFCPSAPIVILHRDPIPEIMKFSSRFGGIQIRQMSTDGILAPEVCGQFGRPAQAFKLALWRWVGQENLESFVFIDADAWIVRDISPLFEAAKSKVFVATTENIIADGMFGAGEPLLNTGVFAYSHGRKVNVTYDRLVEEFHLCGDTIPVPTGEQGLIWSYFNRIGYNWELPEIGQEYNTFANGIRIGRLDDDVIEIYAAKTAPDIDRWARSWLGWGNQEPARVVHAISKYKWWTLPETAGLWDYVCGEVDSVEHGTGRRVRPTVDEPAPRNSHRKFAAWKIQDQPEASHGNHKKATVPGLVSVVIPTYNRPELLSHAIGLIRCQSYKNIEIIIVEDSDPELRIRQIAAPDITHVQLGRRFATGVKHNMALNAARGEWICHWDDDDWYSHDRIERQLKFMIESNAQVSGMNRDFVLSTDGSWWHIHNEGVDPSWLGNASCRAFYDFHDGTAIFRRDSIPEGASYGDQMVSQKVWLLNAILRGGAEWVRVPNDNMFVYIRHAKNVWKFDEAKVRRPAERPSWFPGHELKFYTSLPRK